MAQNKSHGCAILLLRLRKCAILASMTKEERRTIQDWVNKIGLKVAASRLIGRGFSTSLADKVCASRYQSPLSPKRLAILKEEMAKNDVLLAGRLKAS